MNLWGEMHQRIFEGALQGAFFLIYKVDEKHQNRPLDDCFIAGKHFDYFTSPEDLAEKSAYYLANDALRREIAENLRELVKSRYTYHFLLKSFWKTFADK